MTIEMYFLIKFPNFIVKLLHLKRINFKKHLFVKSFFIDYGLYLKLIILNFLDLYFQSIIHSVSNLKSSNKILFT